MNNRISELIQELNGIRGLLWTEEDKEELAQLIVRECMEQVWYTREDGINGNISEVIKDRMKEHFGVEE